MVDESGYQAPSDDLDTLVEQVENYWLNLIIGGGYPGQAGYVEHLVRLAIKAAEHGWLTDGSSGLTADNLTDRISARHPDILDNTEQSRQFDHLISRWEHWAEMLSAALRGRLISIRDQG